MKRRWNPELAGRGLKINRLPVLNERLFLRSPNINVSFRIKIAGTFTRNNFEKAVDIVSQRHPLLKAVIEKGDKNDLWFVPGAGGVVIEFYTPQEMRDWQDWYKKTDNIPFDFFTGPLVKMCVILDDDGAEIILLGHHIMGDGMGYLKLIKDLLLVLDNKFDASPQVPAIRNDFRQKIRFNFFIRQYAKILNAQWNRNRVVFSEDDYRCFFREYRSAFSPSLHFASIKDEPFERLLEMGRRNKVTVNELISSAFTVSTAEYLSKKKIRLGAVIDTRNELITDVSQCMGNYISGIAVNVSCGDKKPFAAKTRQIAKMLKKKIKNPSERCLPVNFVNEIDKDLLEAMVLAVYGKYKIPAAKIIGALMGEGLKDRNVGISNLGRHTFDAYDQFKILDFQFIAPVFPANLLSVSVITVNNCLTLCLGYNESQIKSEVAKKICAKAVDLMCSGAPGAVVNMPPLF